MPIKKTAKRIVWSKYINFGQTCIAPDYLVVQKNIKSILVNNLINEIKSAFGKNPINSPDYGRIIHKKHFDKLKLSLKNQKILYGGIQDEKQLYFGPTLVDEPPNESILMQEEIFGPILPIISFDSENQMHQIFKGREKPLAFYIFSNNSTTYNHIIDCDEAFVTGTFSGIIPVSKIENRKLKSTNSNSLVNRIRYLYNNLIKEYIG